MRWNGFSTSTGKEKLLPQRFHQAGEPVTSHPPGKCAQYARRTPWARKKSKRLLDFEQRLFSVTCCRIGSLASSLTVPHLSSELQ